MNERPSAPIERLVLSRERMRVALQNATTRRATGGGASGEVHAAWLDAMKAIPGVGAVVEAACQWWDRHPLRTVGTALMVVAKATLQPVAQRHPIGLLLGAAVLGAVLVWSRPWRALIRPALWAGLLPSILTSAAARAPMQTWLDALAALSRPAGPVAAH
jgi:hypothetical protein